jgi:hypothetical protein
MNVVGHSIDLIRDALLVSDYASNVVKQFFSRQWEESAG